MLFPDALILIMSLVLESPAVHAKLLIDERPRVQPWHERLADLIATVMQEHGHATPRAVALAQREATGKPVARIRARWAARRRETPPRQRSSPPEDGHAEGSARPT